MTSPRRQRRPRTSHSWASASVWRSRGRGPLDERRLCAGQLEATVTTSLPAVFAINSTALHDEPEGAGRGERAAPAACRTGQPETTFLEPVDPPDEGVDLTKAERIVCVGRDRRRRQHPGRRGVAEALHAELGASRPVIDSGWLPKVRQVGKSGAKVRPKLYCSGCPRAGARGGDAGGGADRGDQFGSGRRDLQHRPLRRGKRGPVRRRRRAHRPGRRLATVEISRLARARLGLPERLLDQRGEARRPRSPHRRPCGVEYIARSLGQLTRK